MLPAAFLCGAIPFGYLIARVIYRADIRTLGSGNIGMTNVWRNFGAGAGVATLILDALKGALPVLAGRWLLHAPFGADTQSTALMLGGLALAAILGTPSRHSSISRAARASPLRSARSRRSSAFGCSSPPEFSL